MNGLWEREREIFQKRKRQRSNRLKQKMRFNMFVALQWQVIGIAHPAPIHRTTRIVPTRPTPTDSRTATSPVTTTPGNSTKGAESYDTRKIKAKTNTGTCNESTVLTTESN